MSVGRISSYLVILGTPLYLKHRKKHVLNMPAQTEIARDSQQTKHTCVPGRMSYQFS